ncbi:MAG: hypothetical protein DRJ41_00210 [Thermoprotei archaeon]|nr:MAG: hypothetical protein DRJ41_00210 [Thermoprotei archaeon]
METYTAVRAHGLITHLLKDKDYMDLIEERKTLSDFKYKAGVTFQEKINSISAKFAERISLLERIGGDKLSPFFKAYLDFLEMKNVEYKLRYLKGYVKEEMYYPYSHFIPLERITLISSEKDLFDLLKKTPYMPTVKGLDLLKLPHRIVEVSVESSYYAYLKAQAKNARLNKRTLRMIDLEVLIRLVYWLLNLNKNDIYLIKKYNIIDNFYPITFTVKENLERIIRAFNLELSKIKPLIRKKEVLRVTSSLYASLLSMAKKEAMNDPVSYGFIYYYMLLSKIEFVNLERIIIGKNTGLRPEVIQASLIPLP